MFDVINGLPIHPLVVHAIVVLIPLPLIVIALVWMDRRQPSRTGARAAWAQRVSAGG